MKNLLLLLCLFVLAACHDKSVTPPQLTPPVISTAPQLVLTGTYNVNYLSQYQNGQLVFEGNLPALINNKITIRHALSIELPAEPSPTVASIGYAAYQSEGNYSSDYGRPVTSKPAILKATQTVGTFDFYDEKGNRLGTSDGTTLSFDFMVLDSLSKPVRYVYKAVKVSSKPNYFPF